MPLNSISFTFTGKRQICFLQQETFAKENCLKELCTKQLENKICGISLTHTHTKEREIEREREGEGERERGRGRERQRQRETERETEREKDHICFHKISKNQTFTSRKVVYFKRYLTYQVQHPQKTKFLLPLEACSRSNAVEAMAEPPYT